MRPALLALPLAAALVAACSGGGSTPAPASAAPAASPDASPVTPAASRIEVTLSDSLKIEPAKMTVPAGVPVTFAVTNSGKAEHEFVLGDEAEQAEHEEEMAGGHMSEDENAITVPPGTTRELTVTFEEPGTTIAGCHVTGHYDAGMRATITIE